VQVSHVFPSRPVSGVWAGPNLWHLSVCWLSNKIMACPLGPHQIPLSGAGNPACAQSHAIGHPRFSILATRCAPALVSAIGQPGGQKEESGTITPAPKTKAGGPGSSNSERSWLSSPESVAALCDVLGRIDRFVSACLSRTISPVLFDCLARVQCTSDTAFRHQPSPGVQLLQPRRSAWGIISFQSSIRGAGHKFDRPLGGNSRLQQEILQLKNEESTDCRGECPAGSAPQPPAGRTKLPTAHHAKMWWGRIRGLNSIVPVGPLTSALSDEDEIHRDSSLDDCGAQSGPGPVQNLCVRCLRGNRKVLGMGTRSDHGVLLVLARCRALQVQGPAARQRAGDPTPATFGELEAPTHTRAATGGGTWVLSDRTQVSCRKHYAQELNGPSACASPLCVNGAGLKVEMPLCLSCPCSHIICLQKWNPSGNAKPGKQRGFPVVPHTSGLSL
jgi:hypothetical protein